MYSRVSQVAFALGKNSTVVTEVKDKGVLKEAIFLKLRNGRTNNLID